LGMVLSGRRQMVQKINQRRILESVPILPAKVKLLVAVGWSEPASGFPTVQEIHTKTYLEGSTSASEMFNLPGR